MAGDRRSQEPAAAAAPARSTLRHISASLKREHADDGDTDRNGGSHPGQPSAVAGDSVITVIPDGRKRRAGLGSSSARGVANLTPEQLAKKRANDREAQRAIRERTRNEIEGLRRRIEELTNQKPYQELQAVIKAKEAVEAENMEIKQRLAAVISMLQPLVGSHVASPPSTLPTPSESQGGAVGAVYQQPHPFGFMPSQTSLTVESPSNNVSTPARTVSPSGSVDLPSSNILEQTHIQLSNSQIHSHHQHWQPGSRPDLGVGDCHNNPNEPLPYNNSTQQHHPQAQARQQAHQAPSLRSTNNYQYNPTQHRGRQQHTHDGQGIILGTDIDAGVGHHLGPDLDPRLDPRPYSSSRVSDVAETRYSGGDINASNMSSGSMQEELIPNHSMPVKNCPRTCPLDGMLMDTLQERRQRAAEGLAPSEITGPRYPSVSSLLNPPGTPSDGRALHPISKVFTDILHAFPHMSGEPERIAIHYIMSLILRWQLNPTPENYEYLPIWIRPLSSQLTLAHPVWMDYVPFPLLRDRLVRNFSKADADGLTSYWMTEDAKDSIVVGDSSKTRHISGPYPGDSPPVPFDHFAGSYTDTISLNWPHRNRSSLLESTGTGDDPIITPAFESHLRNLDNWTLGPAFAFALPHLQGLYNVKNAEGHVILADRRP